MRISALLIMVIVAQANIVINDATKFRHPVDWKLRLLDILVSFFGDSDASKITVLELAPSGQVRC